MRIRKRDKSTYGKIADSRKGWKLRRYDGSSGKEKKMRKRIGGNEKCGKRESRNERERDEREGVKERERLSHKRSEDPKVK